MKNLCRNCSLLVVVCAWLVTTMTVALAAEPVNWESGVIRVTGGGVAPARAGTMAQARNMARRAAVVDGYRQLAEIINGVDVTGETTVEMAAAVSDVIKTRVHATIRGARVIEERMTPDGGYEVVMEVSLFGVSNSVAAAVMEPPAQPKEFPPPVPEVIPSLPADSGTGVVGTFSQVSTPPESSMSPIGGFTGLVVDCRGLGLKAVMSPVIKNESGVPIYGHENLNYDLVVRDGMVGYSSNAANVSRAGNHPLVVKAQSLSDHNANPVLSVADANRVLIENGATGFLNKTCVVFLR